MVIRERDRKAREQKKKALEEELERARRRLPEIEEEIGTLECERDSLEDTIVRGESALTKMMEEDNPKPVLARSKPRPRTEAHLKTFFALE